jgi:hypothetical protein
MERALATLVERGAGREAAILQNNLAIARYPLQGPRRSLMDFANGIAFCEQRGLRESAAQLEANRPGLLAELGQVAEALDDIERLVPRLEEEGDVFALIEIRGVALACRVARGERPPDGEAAWLVETARTIGTVDITVIALTAAAAAAFAEGSVEDGRALLSELNGFEGSRNTPYYVRTLPDMVRRALAVDDRTLAERLAEGIVRRHAFDELALWAARAQLAEHARAPEAAAQLYADAAWRWQEFGNMPERAYALLGQGRCLRALGRPGAEEPLLEARELFASMGYEPMVAEADGLLRPTQFVPAS